MDQLQVQDLRIYQDQQVLKLGDDSAQIFQIDLVLDNIFKYLPLTDLLQIRLVSTKCYENSRKFLNKLKNRLKPVKLLDIVWRYNNHYDFTFHFKDFNETFACVRFEDILITKFIIPGVCFTEGFLDSYEGSHAMEFFLKFSPHILKKLIITMNKRHAVYHQPKYFDPDIILQKTNIKWPKFISLEFIYGPSDNTGFLVEVQKKSQPEPGQYKYVKAEKQSISNTQIPQLEELKSLKIMDIWIWDETLYENLVKISPKLSKISFPDFENPDEIATVDNSSIYSGYYAMLNMPHGQMCNLTKLRFTHVTDNFLNILINLTKNNGMKLKSLIVHSEHAKYHTFDFLHELLRLHKDWIEEIDIRKSQLPIYFDDDEFIPWILDFEMPKLEKLTISSKTGHIRVKYNQLSQLFPQLKTLQIYQDSDDNRTHRFLWDDLNQLENNPHNGITELAILSSPISWKNCLLKLPKSFPNVAKLTLRLGHEKLLEFLPLVWTLWPEKLEKLTLIFDYHKYDHEEISLFQKAFFGDENSTYSIKYFAALNELTLFRDLCLTGEKIGEIFSEMKNLRKITFIDEYDSDFGFFTIGNRRFSKNCQEMLRENEKIVKFITQHDDSAKKLFLPEKESYLYYGN